MLYRIVSLLILLLYCSSCSFFSSDAKQHDQKLDTIVNFSKVDVSPSFIICDSLIDNDKTTCFRNTIHQEFTKNLSKHRFKVKNTIDEKINLDLLIDSKGKVSLQQIHSSKKVQEELPKLDSLLTISVCQLPKLRPAIKRGIPVTTQYQLPILIQVKE